MTIEGFAMGFAAFIGLAALIRLIRRRDQQLLELLRAFSKQQLEWSRKKARAAMMAKLAASRKGNEDLSELTSLIQENSAEPTAKPQPQTVGQTQPQ